MVQWQGVSGVGLYHLQVTRNGDFTSRLVVDDSTVAGASMTVGPLDGAVQYSWRVRAVLGMGTGPWSAVRQFTVTPAAARTLAVSATIPFPSYGSQSEYASSDYRLVGLPGIGTSLLSVIMGGVAGVDWQAYWDNGASDSNFVRYDGDPVFVPGSGRGYWMLKRGPWIVLTSVDAMHVDSASQSVFIPLHPGWNIVTDPYNWRLSAEKVGTANGISEPFYGYRGGFYKADTMEALLQRSSASHCPDAGSCGRHTIGGRQKGGACANNCACERVDHRDQSGFQRSERECPAARS
jgi:hypothetical protein